VLQTQKNQVAFAHNINCGPFHSVGLNLTQLCTYLSDIDVAHPVLHKPTANWDILQHSSFHL
jgi:hypothetical protein